MGSKQFLSVFFQAQQSVYCVVTIINEAFFTHSLALFRDPLPQLQLFHWHTGKLEIL